MQENKNEKVNENERAPGMRPRLALYHANAKGTGCAIKMELHPAVGAADGSIFCTFAAQKTIGNRLGPNPTFPTFDWTEAITVKLAFDDLTKMQQVFRMHRRSLLRREHRRRRPEGRASVCASASRSTATTGSGTARRWGTRRSSSAISSTRFRATPLRCSSPRRTAARSGGGCSCSCPRRRWASAR